MSIKKVTSLSSDNPPVEIITEYEEITIKTLVERRIYKKNVPDKVLYPNNAEEIIEMPVLNHWYDKHKGTFFYKIGSGFLVVDESELAKYNDINW